MKLSKLASLRRLVTVIDKSSIFLMAREKQDIKRNALVSLFLRVLEYYSGILFLTTNRVGTFDPGFRSRIHMSLFYPKLDQKATIDIWRTNLRRTKKVWGDSIIISDEDQEKILAFAEDHYKENERTRKTWNGRQIRNAFQTAIALAEYEIHKALQRFKMAETPSPTLEVWQFEKVAAASRHFDSYLKTVLNVSAQDRAREHHERNDDFGIHDDSQDSLGKKRGPKSQFNDRFEE